MNILGIIKNNIGCVGVLFSFEMVLLPSTKVLISKAIVQP